VALSATVYHLEIALSDVDRNVYETLDLRVAQHPSESMRYFLTRTLAYCLSYEEGITFSKGGLSQTDEPPVAIRDLTGVLMAWIDVGAPSAERLHKASKAARRVALFTSTDWVMLRREAATRAIHKLDEIEVWHVAPAFLDALEGKIDRRSKLELLRNDGNLYVTIDGTTIDGVLTKGALVAEGG
jgi:uncharacterized protein YaeQ